jgi:hypothetical protein
MLKKNNYQSEILNASSFPISFSKKYKKFSNFAGFPDDEKKSFIRGCPQNATRTGGDELITVSYSTGSRGGDDRMSSMSIFDNRLIPGDAFAGASPPNIAANTFRVDATWKITNAFLWVKNFAASQPGGKIDTFNILCHGIYNYAPSEELKQTALVGGFGLQLCSEGLLPGNIDLIVPYVKDKIGEIYIYACGAASTQSNSQNGRNFCLSLAKKLNCAVFAADRMQVYNYSRTAAALNFGEWEGTVSQFLPDGTATVVGKFAAKTKT